MIKMGKESDLNPSNVIEQAVAFFGPEGAGLKVLAHDNCCARFEGGGGYVYVQASELDGSKHTQVTAEGREWDYQIKKFISKI